LGKFPLTLFYISPQDPQINTLRLGETKESAGFTGHSGADGEWSCIDFFDKWYILMYIDTMKRG